MPFNARVFQMLIASPSDVQEERKIISEIIYDWNLLNSKDEKIVLLPVKWETHAIPEYSGNDTQEILNNQFVRDCDILIGAFWTKLGTPTKKYDSGTIEEIEEFISLKKPIMLYFSTAHIPYEHDAKELERVKSFKKKYQGKGIYTQYNSGSQLKDELNKALTREIRRLKGVTTQISKDDISQKDDAKIILYKRTLKKRVEKIMECLKLIIEDPYSYNEEISKVLLDYREDIDLGYSKSLDIRPYGFSEEELGTLFNSINNPTLLLQALESWDVFIQYLNAHFTYRKKRHPKIDHYVIEVYIKIEDSTESQFISEEKGRTKASNKAIEVYTSLQNFIDQIN
ncbi:hypothetical protein [Bacillus paramycoides]|uniref:hypothetical protein n=1 Tax=Bacillus paramycoides TaxID=2026194 RepID=UPI002E1FCDB3|nr:hypothetical protein [Bacillus paramycoides]